MNKVPTSLIAMLTILSVNSLLMAYVDWNDGAQDHVLDGSNHINDRLRLDYNLVNPPNSGTHVDLVEGGYVRNIELYESSNITMSGGIVGDSIFAYDNTSVTISDGLIDFWILARGNASIEMTGGTVADEINARGDSTVTFSGGYAGFFSAADNATAIFSGGTSGWYLTAWENANLTMSGGTVTGWLGVNNDATITLSGGVVMENLAAEHNGIIYLDGTNFEITDLDGITTSLSFGDKLSDYGTYRPEGASDYYWGTITGTLADGAPLENEFYINNTNATGDIIIIPEPATVSLLALGGLAAWRRRRG